MVADDRGGKDPWDQVVLGLEHMAPPDPKLGPRWFPGARLNFAENLLRYGDDREALVFWNERGRQRALTFRELRAAAAAVAGALAADGVKAGDRVAGFLPNLPETVIAMLGVASLGAVWSSCSPDFGAGGVLDRFGQIRPRVLIAGDGYRYAGKEIDCLGRVREVRRAAPRDRACHRSPLSRGAAACLRHSRGGALGGLDQGRFRAGRFCAPAVRPSPLHHVLLGNDRPAQVHGAWRGGNPAATPEGAGASHRPHPRRPDLLLHHVRLDDVELAGVLPGCGRDGRVVRRCTACSAQHPVGPGRAGAGDGVRYQRQVPRARREGGSGAGTESRSRAVCAPSFPPAARWRRTATTTYTAASSATCTSRVSAAGRTSSPASPWGIPLDQSGGESYRRGASAWR